MVPLWVPGKALRLAPASGLVLVQQSAPRSDWVLAQAWVLVLGWGKAWV